MNEKLIYGKIFDHNLLDEDIYIICIENNINKYEIITKNNNWLLLCETDHPKLVSHSPSHYSVDTTSLRTISRYKNCSNFEKFKYIPVDSDSKLKYKNPRKEVLNLMKKSIEVTIIGSYFQSDHINTYTNCPNEGLTLLENGGFLSYYDEEIKKHVTFYLSPDSFFEFYKYKNGYIFSKIIKIVEPFDKVEIEERDDNVTILTIPVDENVASTLKILNNGENVDFEIGCTRTENDGEKREEFTKIRFNQKIKNFQIIGNPTPNGFYKKIIYEKNNYSH